MNQYAVRIRMPNYHGFREVRTMVQAANITQALQLLPLVVGYPMWPTHCIAVARVGYWLNIGELTDEDRMKRRTPKLVLVINPLDGAP